ncbi:MAG: lytic transglycosylase domain-containing protein [Candidatus Binataceae bacterium]|nr:lytic transglycosylase domain-containing protein [Candidatus Binataceae bacterium]
MTVPRQFVRLKIAHSIIAPRTIALPLLAMLMLAGGARLAIAQDARHATAIFAARPDAAPLVTGDGAAQVSRMLRAAARLYGLDPALLTAIAAVESNGNPRAVSPKGARGLMQLMPATAARFGVVDPFDPVENALGAARFLSKLRQWQARRPDLAIDLPELIAAYNAGPAAIEKYHGIPPCLETREYVRRVLISYLIGAPAGAAGAGWPAPAATRYPLGAPLERDRIPPARSPHPVRRGALAALGATPDARHQLDEIRRLRALARSDQPGDRMTGAPCSSQPRQLSRGSQ